MRRIVAGLVVVGALTLVATQALAGDPAPVVVNGHANPAVGAVVGHYTRLPDGSCDVGAAGFEMSASNDVAVEFDDDCNAIVVPAEPDPAPSPGGHSVDATP